MNASNGDNGDNGNRTHEPSLRELTAELDGLRDLLLAKIVGQSEALQAADKRYEQRFIAQEGAVQSALTAQEKAVNAALIAADRAVAKVETSNEKRFESVNEFRGQLADQAAGFLPRNEANIIFGAANDKLESMRKEIQSLRESRSEGAGRFETRVDNRMQGNWDRSYWLAIAGLIAGGISTYAFLHH